MTRTEREQRITRTIETTYYKVWAIDESDNVTTFEFKAVKTDEKQAVKITSQECEKRGLIFVRCKAIKTESNLYVTTLDEFLKIAHIENSDSVTE